MIGLDPVIPVFDDVPMVFSEVDDGRDLDVRHGASIHRRVKPRQSQEGKVESQKSDPDNPQNRINATLRVPLFPDDTPLLFLTT